NAHVLRSNAEFAAYMGHFDAAMSAARHAVVLDPLSRRSHTILGRVLYSARRYAEAAAAFAETISLDPDDHQAYGERGLALYVLGDRESARVSCEAVREDRDGQWCLAVLYDKLGRHGDAAAELKKLQATEGDAAAYQYATVYGQWGNRAKALEWLDTAMRVGDRALEFLKTDPLMDPLRKEPRFQAIERELKFPSN